MNFIAWVPLINLILGLVNFILLIVMLIIAITDRRLNKATTNETLFDSDDLNLYDPNDPHRWDNFDERIEKLKREIKVNADSRLNDAEEFHPNVKNIPHEDVAHHVAKHIRDEVAD